MRTARLLTLLLVGSALAVAAEGNDPTTEVQAPAATVSPVLPDAAVTSTLPADEGREGESFVTEFPAVHADATNAFGAIVSLGESALRDGLVSLAQTVASEAWEAADAETERERAFLVMAAANERDLDAAEFLSWIRTQAETMPSVPRRYYLGRALAANGDVRAAEALFAEIRPLLATNSPLAFPALLDHAQALAACGRTKDAIRLLERSGPTSATVSLYLARLHLATGDRARVRENLAVVFAAEKGDGLSTAATLLLARAMGDEAGVTNALSALVSVRPELRILYEGTTLRLLARDGRFREVLDLAPTFIAHAPKDEEAASALRDAAAMALASGGAEAAVRLCRLHLASFSLPKEEPLLEAIFGEALSATGDHAGAAAAYRRAVAAMDRWPDGHLPRRAWFLCLLHEAEENRLAGLPRLALTPLRRILSNEPPRAVAAAARLAEAECKAALGDADAEAAFLSVAADFPGTPESILAYVRAAKRQSDLAGGDPTALRRAIDTFGHAAASPWLQPVAEEAGDFVSLPGTTETLVSTNEIRSIRAKAAIAVSLLRQRLGDTEEALVSLDEAVSLSGGGAVEEQAESIRPPLLFALGRVHEAEEAYDRFAARYPQSAYSADLRFWRATRAFNAADWNTALGLFDAFVAENPEDGRVPHALQYATVSAFRAARYEDAIREAEALTTRFPAFERAAAVRFVQAEALCRLLSFREAARLFERVTEDAKGDAWLLVRATVRLGDCLFTLIATDPDNAGKSAAAYRMAMAELAAARNPDPGLEAECQYKIARSLEKAGRAEEAIRAYYATVILPAEKRPDPATLPWAVRARTAASALLRAAGRADEADALLRPLRSNETTP